MITERNILDSVAFLRELGAARIVLFGSAVSRPEFARDLDFGCLGVPCDQFFYAAGRLSEMVGKPVDLIDLGRADAVCRHIEKYGKLIYDRR